MSYYHKRFFHHKRVYPLRPSPKVLRELAKRRHFAEVQNKLENLENPIELYKDLINDPAPKL